MKLLPLCLLLFFAVDFELAQVRQNYINAAQTHKHAQDFYKAFEAVTETHPDATIVAYKAASQVLMAKYEGGLVSKMRYFNRGKKLLEKVIDKAPDNYEARLIRLNIQDNVPWITGYTGDIDDDKAFLIKNYSKQDAALKAFTKKYILQSGAFSDKEKAQFK
jgi:tetratricopeptide (TPR) repeat protein